MKKLLAIVISMAMVVAMMPMGVFAADDNCVAEINGEHYQTLQAAVEAAKTGETITLVKSFSTEEQIEITDKQITLDLNGNSLTKTNDESKTGHNLALIYVHSGSEGKTEGKVTIIDTKGEGKLISNDDNILYLDGGTIEQVSGTVESTGYWIYGGQAYGNVIVNVLGSETDIENYSEFVMGKDAVISSLKTTTGYEHVGCGYVMVGPVGPEGNKSAFGANMNISGRIENAVLYVNGQIAKSTGNVPNFNVHNTAVVNGGIYAAGYAKWNIEGANITGATGIEIRAGELIVSDNAKITGTSVPTTVTPNGNGSTTDGAGIAIAQHNTKLPIDVKISSGDIKGFSALYESNPQGSSAENIAKVKIAVSGGNFTAINGGTKAIYSEDKNNFITGGAFSDLSALDYVNENADIEISLNGDLSTDKKIEVGEKQKVAIDLGGKTLTSTANPYAIQSEGTFILKNGGLTTANLGIKATNGEVTLTDVEITAGERAIANYDASTVNVNAGTVVKADNYGVVIWGDEASNKQPTLNVNGGTIEAEGIAISGNGTDFSGTTINITNNSKVKGATGIYHPQKGSLNISDNATVEATTNTAIEAKAGDTKIGITGSPTILTNGTIAHEPNSNGTSTAGYALALVENSNYAGKPTAFIAGGTFTGGLGIVSDSEVVESKKAGLTITGGTFSTDPSAYVASGYYVDKSGETWTVKPVPYTPSTPADNVTNNTIDKNTTADLTPAVSDNKSTTTVDNTTADKIVDKAVENKSTEVIVDATGNNTVASSEVAIPEKTVKELAEKTDANLVIKTDNGKVDLDKTALAAVAEQAGTTGTVRLVVETVKTDENICHVDLKLITSNGAVKDFRGGNVKVTINLTKELAAKELVCVYIDDNDNYTIVEGVLNADGTYTFTTGHFSEYAVMAKAEADKKIAEQLDTMIKDVNLKVRTSKTAKKNIKAVVSGDVKALTDAGYTVKYKFYRSEKKASKYEAKATKAGKTYINTAGKKGTKYYYKAKALVYDGDKLVGQTVLKQCKYGARTWSK